MIETHGKPIEILLVEDNPGDVLLIKEALADAKVRNNLHVVKDGVEALTYLHKEKQYINALRPMLILLDLNLPKKDGQEVLKEIKSDENLRRIPVVIMTSSQDEEDVLKAYDLQANCFITKPVNFEQFIKVVKSIEDFWFTVVQLPPNDNG